jgi:hypothetical protein
VVVLICGIICWALSGKRKEDRDFMRVILDQVDAPSKFFFGIEKGESISRAGMVVPRVPGLNTERTHSVDAEEYNDTVDISFGAVGKKESVKPIWVMHQGKICGGVGS